MHNPEVGERTNIEFSVSGMRLCVVGAGVCGVRHQANVYPAAVCPNLTQRFLAARCIEPRRLSV
jgi:hypothetical protein